MQQNIYALKLQNGKYYIGKSPDAERRIQQHISGEGSMWTNKYKYVATLEVFAGDDFAEDATVKKYMNKYGIDNVRGGSYITEWLTDSQYDMLERELRMANNECLRCGRDSHFIANCYAKTDVNGKYIKDSNRSTKQMMRSNSNNTSTNPISEPVLVLTSPQVVEIPSPTPIPNEATNTVPNTVDSVQVVITSAAKIIDEVGHLMKSWWG